MHVVIFALIRCFFFFKQKTAYEIMPSLVGSEMCIRDSSWAVFEARWIPLEETYFKAHAVQALADLTLDTTPFA